MLGPIHHKPIHHKPIQHKPIHHKPIHQPPGEHHHPVLLKEYREFAEWVLEVTGLGMGLRPMGTIMPPTYQLKGNVRTRLQLPRHHDVGDVWVNSKTDVWHIWDGTHWFDATPAGRRPYGLYLEGDHIHSGFGTGHIGSM